MAQKLFIILGNGFTIDFINQIDKTSDINVSNLFQKGCEVPWPVNKNPGFLSFRYCPNLWNLGARPNMDDENARDLMEDIITCVNVYATYRIKDKKSGVGQSETQPNDIYIYAYKELAQYLKHLFVSYNKLIPEIPDSIANWSWVKFLRHHVTANVYDEISIVTYNYDVWLERILQKFLIPFNVACIGAQTAGTKITIYKPHGSISFAHKEELDMDSYSISKDRELPDGACADFSVTYEDMDSNYLVSAMIPPAGESARFNHTWAREIRTAATDKAKTLTKDDEIILCGSSYWHVDRSELDELITNCDKDIALSMINPHPKRTLNAVLTSIFSNFVAYTNSKILEQKT